MPLTRTQCLDHALQHNWTNKFSAKISVTNLATSIRVYDARTLRKGDVLRINNRFGSGCTALQGNTDDVLALRGT